MGPNLRVEVGCEVQPGEQMFTLVLELMCLKQARFLFLTGKNMKII